MEIAARFHARTLEQRGLTTPYTRGGVSHARPPDRIPTRPGDAEVKGIRILGTTGLIVRSAGAMLRGGLAPAVTEIDR